LTKYGKVTQHQFTRLAAGSRQRELIGVLTASEPSYHHSFGLSERFIVFTEFPFVVQPLRILFGTTTIYGSYRWKPELGLHVRLLERSTGRVFGPFVGDACFGFHHVNAWDHEGGLTFDLALLDDHRIFDELLMERVRENGFKIGPHLMRYHLDLASGTMRREALGSGTFDFPMIDESQRCQPTTVVWGCGAADEQPDGMLNQLVRREITACGETTERRWYQPRCYPGEPVFVHRPDGLPNDGVLLSVVLDGCAQRSFLVVLDATTMTECARAELPLVVPFGFHGCFVPE
jgi:beta,beta-carotene 9',10'-dioxygenase